jgi:hypothetical protein
MSEERQNQYRDVLWWDMVEAVSLDPVWRTRLFASPSGVMLPFTADDLARLPPPVCERITSQDLRFGCFNDGATEDGYVVFGICSLEFPELVEYSTNNPEVV